MNFSLMIAQSARRGKQNLQASSSASITQRMRAGSMSLGQGTVRAHDQALRARLVQKRACERAHLFLLSPVQQRALPVVEAAHDHAAREKRASLREAEPFHAHRPVDDAARIVLPQVELVGHAVPAA